MIINTRIEKHASAAQDYFSQNEFYVLKSWQRWRWLKWRCLQALISCIS